MTWQSDVGGFDFETGREFSADGTMKGEPGPEAIVPGDVISTGSEDYRVLEVNPSGVIGFGPFSARQSSAAKVIEWESIDLKWDPREHELAVHDEYPDEIDLKVDPATDAVR